MLRQVLEQIDAGPLLAGLPDRRNAARSAAEAEHEKPDPISGFEYGGARGLILIAAGADATDAGSTEHLEGLDQTGVAPVQHVVVAEHATADS